MLKRIQSVRFLPSRVWLLLAVIGPGLITANADNDASGIFGYSQAGAAYGYRMLWIIVLSTVALGISQEICARMGAVTGRGLADLIREEYGVKITLFAMLALLVANFATTVSEFAGILAAIQLFVPHEVARLVIMPFVGLAVFLLVTRGTYRKLEKFLLWASLVYLVYIVDAYLAHPHWGRVMKETIAPSFGHVGAIKPYVFMIINVIGTTITPWGQFYIQSSIRDKGIKPEEYKMVRLDVFFGAFFTNFIAFAIIVCCGTLLFPNGNLNDAGEAAKALIPVAGGFAATIFAIGLFNASCFGAITVPLSTAYAVTEALGWESGVGRRIKEAPLFVGIFSFLIFCSVVVVMCFPSNLGNLIILPNIVGGVLLPIILVLMLLLVNKRRLMGQHVNTPVYNVIAWATTVIMILLSVALLGTLFMPAGS
ncbi:MAG: divalent metal cation transporter [Capsulimonadaceae bacterium]|nr:divalent metal cation transporter [Capsulimonadaceae bacterium]